MPDPTAPRGDDRSPRGITVSGPARAYPGGGHDEMRAADGAVREGWAELAALVDRSRPAGLAAATRRLLADEGVTYRPPGEHEQPWALDPLPLPLTAAIWAELEAGVAQRALLLDRLLADLYGPRRTLRTGLLPVEVVFGHPGFVHGWARATPRPRELFLAGTDLVRTPGGWRVLGDRVQAPSGAGYALANRRIVSRVLASVRRGAQIRRLGPFFDAMRRGLEELAPAPDRARVVLLTPGPRSETAYEQALLASRLGFPLVLASELTVREGRVWQRTMGGGHDGAGRLEPVDVILRRVDAAWCDPLDLRQDSHLGVPGLLEAARLGTVAVVNGLGSGVAENPGLLPFLPAAALALLDEPLALAGAPTWWCGEATGRSHVLAHLADLLVKPIARGEGRTTVDGAALTTAERAELAARIKAEPHAWVGQEPQRQSTVPVVAADGSLDASPLVLRTFAVAAGGAFRVLAGGLGEAGTRGATVAKDVWVSGATVPAPAGPTAVGAEAPLSPRVAADLFWLGRYAERARGHSTAAARRRRPLRRLPVQPRSRGRRSPRRAAAGGHGRHHHAAGHPLARLDHRPRPARLARLRGAAPDGRGAGRAGTALHRHLAGAGATGDRPGRDDPGRRRPRRPLTGARRPPRAGGPRRREPRPRPRLAPHRRGPTGGAGAARRRAGRRHPLRAGPARRRRPGAGVGADRRRKPDHRAPTAPHRPRLPAGAAHHRPRQPPFDRLPGRPAAAGRRARTRAGRRGVGRAGGRRTAVGGAAVAVTQRHRRLSVLAESTVAVDERPALATTPPWEAVRDRLRGATDPLLLDARVYTLPSPRLPVHAEVAAYARASFPAGRPVAEAADDLCGRIHRDFRYVTGSSTVGSTVPELLDRGAGVCQDFAHLAVAGLRAMGLATRYVSGYLETTPPPGRPRMVGADASHAWVSVCTGADWLDLDPTNDQLADASYVELAHGRDYADVPPLKGVIFADSTENVMDVAVDMIRVDGG